MLPPSSRQIEAAGRPRSLCTVPMGHHWLPSWARSASDCPSGATWPKIGMSSSRYADAPGPTAVGQYSAGPSGSGPVGAEAGPPGGSADGVADPVRDAEVVEEERRSAASEQRSRARAAAAVEMLADRCDDRCELVLADAGEEREREALARQGLCRREGAGPVAERRIRAREMRRLGVVAPAADPPRAQGLGERRRLGGADDVEVPDRFAAGRDRRQAKVADALELGAVVGRGGAPLVVPGVEQRQLAQRARAPGSSRAGPCSPRRRARTSGSARARGARPPVATSSASRGHERSGVAERAQVLARVEAEGRGATGGARPDPVALGAVRLAGVLDDREPVPLGERAERPHVRHLPVEVHRQEESRARTHGRRRGIRVEPVVGLAHVGDDGQPLRPASPPRTWPRRSAPGRRPRRRARGPRRSARVGVRRARSPCRRRTGSRSRRRRPPRRRRPGGRS